VTMIDRWLSDAFESLDSIEGQPTYTCTSVALNASKCWGIICDPKKMSLLKILMQWRKLL